MRGSGLFFRSKRAEMKDEGRSSKELQEMLAFSTVRDAGVLRSIALHGFRTNKAAKICSVLGVCRKPASHSYRENE